MGLTLREVRDEDLPLLFEQWADPVAVHMAAFTAPDHMDWDAFERRWSRLRADETVLTRVIVVDDEVAGTIGSWGEPGEREGDVLDRPLLLGQRDRNRCPQCVFGR
jgi:RimJ/RimL family protein N-acetyltransferase